MSRNNDMSDLEQEFELEMEGDEGESPKDEELGSDWETEQASDEEADEETDQESESEPTETGGYADRFYELSQRAFESESELDDEVRDIVNDMERNYFWGNWKKRLKKIGGSLIKKGLGHLAGKFPVFKGLQAVTQLARGNVKGALGSLAKAGLTAALSASPAGAVALPALKALGFEATADSEPNREAWDNYVEVAREAFNHLGQNISEAAVDPVEASRLASNAFQTAVRNVQARVRSNGTGVRDHRKRSMTIQVRRGERIIIEGI
jgi:hypothetical protein